MFKRGAVAPMNAFIIEANKVVSASARGLLAFLGTGRQRVHIRARGFTRAPTLGPSLILPAFHGNFLLAHVEGNTFGFGVTSPNEAFLTDATSFSTGPRTRWDGFGEGSPKLLNFNISDIS